MGDHEGAHDHRRPRRTHPTIGRWLTQSSFLEGCPVSTVTLEVTPHSPELTAACRDAYAEWTGLVADDLVEHGRVTEQLAQLLEHAAG